MLENLSITPGWAGREQSKGKDSRSAWGEFRSEVVWWHLLLLDWEKEWEVMLNMALYGRLGQGCAVSLQCLIGAPQKYRTQPVALMSAGQRVVKMQFFCLKLHPMTGLQGCAGLRVPGSSGSLTVWVINFAGAVEASGVGSEKNLLPLTYEFLLDSLMLSGNFPLKRGNFIT